MSGLLVLCEGEGAATKGPSLVYAVTLVFHVRPVHATCCCDEAYLARGAHRSFRRNCRMSHDGWLLRTPLVEVELDSAQQFD
eukprot:6243291-Prymnesium_polylepis.1